MTKAQHFYTRHQKLIENIIVPLILLLYPLCRINQGIDVSDTTYSLANFEYFRQMNGTWIVATFLANVTGSLLMHLPFADTLLGMNFYTTLIQSGTALAAYYVLRKRIAAPVVAAGEFVALGLCWCPSVILYNYLTYFLMTVGILLLYRGILEEQEKHKRTYYILAGVCLGANVAVRMPNVVQAAFILAVWYGVWLDERNHKQAREQGGRGEGRSAEETAEKTGAYKSREGLLIRAVRETGWCVLGYLAGFGIPLVVICIRYGVQAYPAMVQTMFAMTEKASDYKPSSMLTGMFDDYGRGLYWLLFAGICVAAGWLANRILDRFLKGKADTGGEAGYKGGFRAAVILRGMFRLCYIGLFLVLLRFYWGRGMFTFRYYEYDCRSMYYPTVLLLIAALAAAVYCLIGKKVRREQKVFAALVILEVFLAPLGSNNDLYPIINNLFLVAPFFLWTVYGCKTGQRAGCGGTVSWDKVHNDLQDASWQGSFSEEWQGMDDFIWKAPLAVLCVFVCIQSVGFHSEFVFQDGIWGEKRDTLPEMPVKVQGVYTNRDNGEALEELAAYVLSAGLSGRETIFYGEIPGLGYLLDMPSALTTFWPDLDSYRMVEFERDMENVAHGIETGQKSPVMILHASVAAYLSEDAEAMNWFGVDREKMDGDEKLRQLGEFMKKYGYEERFGNARYVVYVPAIKKKSF